MRTLLVAAAVAASVQAQPVRRPAPPALTPVVVETDLACTLTLNGEDQGALPANGTKTFSLPPGEHVFRATAATDSSIVWRRVIQVAGPDRRAVLIELAPLFEQKRAAEAERARAEEAARADERRRTDEAERTRVERERQAAESARMKDAEQRANETARVLAETQRLQLERDIVAEATKARQEQEKRWLEDYTDKKGKVDPEVSVSVTADAEGDHRVLVFEYVRKTREIKRYITKVAMMQWKGEPAFRFTMRHVHAKECVGDFIVSAARLAYDPAPAAYKQDAFDVERSAVDTPGKITRTGMLKIDIPQRNYDFVVAFRTQDGDFDFLLKEVGGMIGISYDNAVQFWARRALTDFAGAKKEFERLTVDVKIASTR